MNVRKIIKDIKKEDRKLIVRILIIILLMILIVITSFNAGKKFYYLKNTFSENKNVECKGKIAKWNFDAKININNEEISEEELYSEWLESEEFESKEISTKKIDSQDENDGCITYTINAYKLTLDTTNKDDNIGKAPNKERKNIQQAGSEENAEIVDEDNTKTVPEVEYDVQKRNNNDRKKDDNKDTFVIIKNK